VLDSHVIPEPTTSGERTLEASTAPGRASAKTRAGMCTAMPPTPSAPTSTSPVCSPARICNPSGARTSRIEHAQQIARSGLSARIDREIILRGRREAPCSHSQTCSQT
jgi:hypothetical protein